MTWFRVQQSDGVAHVRILDNIGCFGEDAGALLDEIGDAKEVRLHVDSLGGNSRVALEVYDGIKDRVSTATIRRCGSSAVTLALAARRIEIFSHGRMLVHAPVLAVMGSAQDLQQSARYLADKIVARIAEIICDRTGRDVATVSRWLSGPDFWFDAEQAVAESLADCIIPMPATERAEGISPATSETIAATIAAPVSAVPHTVDTGNEALFFDFLRAFGPVRVRDRRSFARNLNVLLAKNVKETQ